MVRRWKRRRSTREGLAGAGTRRALRSPTTQTLRGSCDRRQRRERGSAVSPAPLRAAGRSCPFGCSEPRGSLRHAGGAAPRPRGPGGSWVTSAPCGLTWGSTERLESSGVKFGGGKIGSGVHSLQTGCPSKVRSREVPGHHDRRRRRSFAARAEPPGPTRQRRVTLQEQPEPGTQRAPRSEPLPFRHGQGKGESRAGRPWPPRHPDKPRSPGRGSRCSGLAACRSRKKG